MNCIYYSYKFKFLFFFGNLQLHPKKITQKFQIFVIYFTYRYSVMFNLYGFSDVCIFRSAVYILLYLYNSKI